MRADVLVRMYGESRSVAPFAPAFELRVPLIAGRLSEAQITAEHIGALVVWAIAAPVMVLLAWFSLGGWLAVALAAVLVASPVLFVVARKGRRTRQTIRLLPEAVDMLSRSLRSGASLPGGLRETLIDGPAVVATELRPIVEALERGRPIDHVLQDWVARSPLPEFRIVASALALASANQAGASRALDGVSQSLRDRSVLASEITSLTAQASASMQAMVALPAGFLLLDGVGSQRVLRYLFQEPFGQACLALGVVLNMCGLLWMRSLVARGSHS